MHWMQSFSDLSPSESQYERTGNVITAAIRKETRPYTLIFLHPLQETPPGPSGPLTKTSPEKMWGREMPGPGGQRV